MQVITQKRFEHLMSYVEQVTESGCWIWMGTTVTSNNGLTYGRVWNDGKERKTHRVFYEYFKGPIQPGLVPDHLCRVTLCCNPNHLEPVTNKVNILRGDGIMAKLARQTHCKKGHELSGDNLRIRSGARICVTCRQENGRNQYHRRKAFILGVICAYNRILTSPAVVQWKCRNESAK